MGTTAVTKRNATLAEAGMRECAQCHVVRPFAKFSPKKGRDGLSALSTWCLSCLNTRQRYAYANSARVRDHAKRSDLKRKFGLSLERWNEMFAAQKGCCAICMRHQSEFKKGLVVDHDHETGAIRALLCPPCNSGVGMFREDPALMQAAINYLKAHPAFPHGGDDAKKEG